MSRSEVPVRYRFGQRRSSPESPTSSAPSGRAGPGRRSPARAPWQHPVSHDHQPVQPPPDRAVARRAPQPRPALLPAVPEGDLALRRSSTSCCRSRVALVLVEIAEGAVLHPEAGRQSVAPHSKRVVRGCHLLRLAGRIDDQLDRVPLDRPSGWSAPAPSGRSGPASAAGPRAPSGRPRAARPGPPPRSPCRSSSRARTSRRSARASTAVRVSPSSRGWRSMYVTSQSGNPWASTCIPAGLEATPARRAVTCTAPGASPSRRPSESILTRAAGDVSRRLPGSCSAARPRQSALRAELQHVAPRNAGGKGIHGERGKRLRGPERPFRQLDALAARPAALQAVHTR